MCIYFFFLAVVKISVLKRINLFVGWTDVLRSDTQVYKCVCLTWSRIKMIYYTQKKKRCVKDTKGHEDQNDLGGRTFFLFTDGCLGHFCLPHHPPKEVIVKGAKSIPGMENSGRWGFPGRFCCRCFWREQHHKGQQTTTGTVRHGETPSD